MKVPYYTMAVFLVIGPFHLTYAPPIGGLLNFPYRKIGILHLGKIRLKCQPITLFKHVEIIMIFNLNEVSPSEMTSENSLYSSP